MGLSGAQNIFMSSIVLLAIKICEFLNGRKPTTDHLMRYIKAKVSNLDLTKAKTIILVIQRQYSDTSILLEISKTVENLR